MSHYLSRFAAFVIDARAKISTAGSLSKIINPKKKKKKKMCLIKILITEKSKEKKKNFNFIISAT